VLYTIFSHPTNKTSKLSNSEADGPETFLLQHPDLDLQNILVDDDGNVSGILDWDECLAVPRCVGCTLLSELLLRDWQPGFTLNVTPHVSYRLDHYRQIYAEALEEPNCPESCFTRNSATYRVIEGTLTSRGNARSYLSYRACAAPTSSSF
jgi:hypothetical protein